MCLSFEFFRLHSKSAAAYVPFAGCRGLDRSVVSWDKLSGQCGNQSYRLPTGQANMCRQKKAYTSTTPSSRRWWASQNLRHVLCQGHLRHTLIFTVYVVLAKARDRSLCTHYCPETQSHPIIHSMQMREVHNKLNQDTSWVPITIHCTLHL